MFNIVVRTKMLGKNNLAVIKEIKKRGQPCTAPEYSNAINGRENAPRHIRIINMADEILKEWEQEKEDTKNGITAGN